MDLNAIRRVKEIQDNETSEEDRERFGKYKRQVLGFFSEELPALSDSDLAAVAWFIAQMLESLTNVPVGRISNMLDCSSAGYALATVELLGWNKTEDSNGDL